MGGGISRNAVGGFILMRGPWYAGHVVMLTCWRCPVVNILSVGDAKRRFSELMGRVAFRGERFLVQRRGRPMVALVSVEDLERLEQEPVAPKGLLAAVGAWADYEDLDRVVEDIYRQRERAQDRPVALEG